MTVMAKVNFSWEVIATYTFKGEHSVKHKTLHVVAPDAIAACDKVNKILKRDYEASKDIGSPKNEPQIFSVEQQDKIDT